MFIEIYIFTEAEAVLQKCEDISLNLALQRRKAACIFPSCSLILDFSEHITCFVILPFVAAIFLFFLIGCV